MAPVKNYSVAVVMDPLPTIKPRKDSTVAMLRAAEKMGAACFYMGMDDLFVEGGKVQGISRQIFLGADDGEWCSTGPEIIKPLTEFDVVLMRKDPPVDKRFLHACYMLEHAVRNGAKVLNNPSALISFNEKLFAGHFPELCPETLVTSVKNVLRVFLDRHRKIIVKPLDAMGGAGVFMVTVDDVNFEVIWELQTLNGSYPVMAQEFIPAVAAGDARVIVINGKPFEHVLVRTPKEGSIRGNMAAGGTTHVRPINAAEKRICEVVGPRLAELGIVFTGLDIIGEYLIEINITSPTGLRQISEACGTDVAEVLMREILK